MVKNNKFPKATKFLDEHPDMSIDDALAYFKKLEGDEKYIDKNGRSRFFDKK